MKKALFFALSGLVAANAVVSQDIHFSQYNETPLVVNPALTGIFSGDNRAIINYRDQWRSVTTPFTTYLLSYDMGLKNTKKKWKKGYLGAGIYAFMDKAGDAEYFQSKVNISVSGIVFLNSKSMLSGGIQGGIEQRGFRNNDNLRWGNQYNSNGLYDSSLPSREPGTPNTFTSADAVAGLAWNFSTKESFMSAGNDLRINADVSLMHINRAKQRFHDIVSDKLYRNMVFHTTIYYGVKNTNFGFKPSVLFMRQGPSQEINTGFLVRYQLKEESKFTGFVKESALYLGGTLRLGDAFAPIVVLEIANYAFGISYDVNVSGLKTASNGQGGVELWLRYISPNPFRYGKSAPMLY